MKKIAMLRTAWILILILLLATSVSAQDFQKLDKDPQDIAYLRASRVSMPMVKVIYGRPSLKDDQEQLTDKISYGKIWRTGANEATEVKFYKDIYFGETLVKSGTYVLLTIPGETEWEIILNSEIDTWGAFQYNPEANIAQLKIPVKKAERLSIFSIGFKRINENAKMVLAWGYTRVSIPIKFTEEYYFAKL
ncbi:DUF2911 domain-containing protein [Aureibaculum sp. 2210JD6-5]|uniref:DUF2911 domain-containing protein n=1 Tax=Aureibaculum sp. 2210JD6-5 TaxID=3103957 RepID=UPI002AAE7587|nr:DUF2911 domain-containing protein [Aureibaculum sp. 2210JD6-5]MDY7394713.1 DUF2911 domain-containing protein [Aureibaculum sp. 2210JD6-5]